MKLEEIRKLTNIIQDNSSRTDIHAFHQKLRDSGLEPGGLYQELEMSRRYVQTHQDISYDEVTVALHSHSYYEIIFCRSSCGVEYLVGSERYRLQKGDVVVVPPGTSHKPLFPQNMTVPYIRDVLWVSQELVDSLSKEYTQETDFVLTVPRLLRTADTRWEYIGDLFRNGVRESERQEAGWETVVLGNSMQLLAYLIRAIHDRDARALRAENPELLEQVMAYVESHLAEKLTLADVAKHFWVSQSTITQTFRNRMGVSFYRMVTQRRLIAAKLLILEGKQLEDVGRMVGFTDYSTFYRAFKQEFGVSPREFRKKMESNDV